MSHCMFRIFLVKILLHSARLKTHIIHIVEGFFTLLLLNQQPSKGAQHCTVIILSVKGAKHRHLNYYMYISFSVHAHKL